MIDRLCTIGFTKKDLRTFVELLRQAGVTMLIDVRLRNTSQLAGYAKKDDLAFVLGMCDIAYEHVPELGPTDQLLDKYKRDKNWRSYAAGFGRLLRQRDPVAVVEQNVDGHRNVCLLCTEETPDHCHRRLVAEYIRKRQPNLEVVHL